MATAAQLGFDPNALPAGMWIDEYGILHSSLPIYVPSVTYDPVFGAATNSAIGAAAGVIPGADVAWWLATANNPDAGTELVLNTGQMASDFGDSVANALPSKWTLFGGGTLLLLILVAALLLLREI